ncbi:MAG: VOC family protein [Casimicrobium sp.]
MNFKTELDHIVIACNTLDEGRAWCREVLGVEATGGGKHANVGTHNTLLGLAAPHYLEIIAIDPEGATPAFPRWFGLDTEEVKALMRNEPRLIGWVARVARSQAATDAIDQLATIPANAANVVRPAERGDFRWRFAFTRDGARQRGGVLPYFIQWDVPVHPCDRLPDVGVSLSSLVLGDPAHEEVTQALQAMQFVDSKVLVGQSTSPHLIATLNTPNGIAVLE